MKFARELWLRIETLHAATYFGEESHDAGKRAGMPGFWMGDFGFRAEPMGAVGLGVVEATFFNLAPGFVARCRVGLTGIRRSRTRWGPRRVRVPYVDEAPRAPVRDAASQATVADATIERCVPRPVEEIAMADVGDRIAVTSKGQPRSGVVTAVSGAMVTVRWDTGGETSLVPGPGALSVVTSRRRTPSELTRPTPSGGTATAKKTSESGSRTAVGRKAGPRKRAAAGKTPVAKKPMAKKASPGKKPVAETATRRKKPVAKGTSSSRTTGKRTR
jgi:Helix-turn-helix family